jgi:hypothetical protein
MDVLNWVALVFVAGFIGYFGKYLAKLLIRRFHKSKVERSSVAQPAEDSKGTSDYKAEKKRIKLAMKRKKKAGDSSAIQRATWCMTSADMSWTMKGTMNIILQIMYYARGREKRCPRQMII